MIKETKKAPTIRFRDFTDDWEQRKLSDVAERVTRKNKNLESTLPLTISAQYGLIDQNEFFDKRIASKDVSGYYLIRKGEFAYNKSTSNDAPWGAIKRLNRYESGVLSTLYIVFCILDKSKTCSDYLASYYDTNLWHKEVKNIAAEGARNHGLLNIAPADFFETKLMIPKNFEEQQMIGEYFSNLDHLITLHQRKLDQLKTLKKYFLQNMFPAKGEKVPRIRFKGFTGDWEQRKLGDVCNQLTGAINPQTRPNELFVEYSMPAYDSGMKPNIVYGFTMNSTRKIVNESCLLINKLNVRKKRIWYIKNPTKNAVCSAEFIPLYSDNIDLLFLNYVVSRDSFTNYLEDCSSGSSNSQKRVTPDIIIEAKVFLPVKDEQLKIGRYFQKIDNLITLHQRKLDQLQTMKKFMLQNMFI